MLFHAILASIGVSGFTPEQGGSMTPCGDLEKIEQIALYAHDARYGYTDISFLLNTRRAADLANDIKAADLIPATRAASFLQHRERLDIYLDRHVKANLKAESGN